MLRGVQSPHGSNQLSGRANWHRHGRENETLLHLSITETCLTRLKREVNGIILILNLCLQVCKDKVRSPSLLSASTVTRYSDVV